MSNVAEDRTFTHRSGLKNSPHPVSLPSDRPLLTIIWTALRVLIPSVPKRPRLCKLRTDAIPQLRPMDRATVADSWLIHQDGSVQHPRYVTTKADHTQRILQGILRFHRKHCQLSPRRKNRPHPHPLQRGSRRPRTKADLTGGCN